jgi:glycosyltransferase involved in cell wall biosynthesis
MMIKILDTSRKVHKLNDMHNYYGGAIGNVAYNLIYTLATKYTDIELHILLDGISFANPQPKNLRFHVLPKKKSISSAISRIYIRYAKKILKKEDISVISQLYFFYAVDFNLLKEIKDYPYVIGMCELPHPRLRDETGVLGHEIAHFGKKLISPLFKRTLEHCDVLIAVNEATKELYANFLPESKIKVIPYGVDLDFFRYSLLPSNHNILAVSRLIERRGLDYLIEAMPKILKDYPDAKLHFVGDGPRKTILQEKAEKLGIVRNVIFHGQVSSEGLVNLYRNCFVFCHLSFADGWNQPALEAMASGRPVVCTEAPHNSMVTDGRTGFLIPFGDVDMLCEKIITLFSNPGLAESMGLEGRKETEKKYNWYKIAREYYEVYQGVTY